MSGWGLGNFFGGNPKNQKDAPKNAILGLRGTLDMLSKREKHLQNQMDEQDGVARKNVSANKNSEYTLHAREASEPQRQRLTMASTQSQKQHYGERKPSNTSSNKHNHK